MEKNNSKYDPERERKATKELKLLAQNLIKLKAVVSILDRKGITNEKEIIEGVKKINKERGNKKR